MNKLPKTKSKQTLMKNKHFFECIDEAFFNYRNEVTLSRINYIDSFNPIFQRALADAVQGYQWYADARTEFDG